MKKHTQLLLLFLSGITQSIFSSEQITFEHYSVENGLSQNTVMTIMQDRRGFMGEPNYDF